jgi:predicted enzyme related to lactoylglutathione lyase
MIKRFDRLEIATSDLADAAAVYEKNFDFTVRPSADSSEATIELGDSQIKLRTGAAVAEQLSASGEGLAAIWLEADDVYQVAEALKNGHIEVSAIRVEADRRILAVAPTSANLVPLFIFDRLSAGS